MIFLVAFFTSFILALLLVRFNRWHSHIGVDDDFDSVQKLHNESVPRIGGIALFTGLLSAVLVNYNADIGLLFISILPIFLIGIVEDLSKRIPPIIRLIAAFISATIVIMSFDISLTSIGWDWFDNYIFTNTIFAVGFSIFMVGGVAHSTNIIDGLNGLLLIYSILVLLIFLVIATQLNDVFIISIILGLLGSVVGLLLLNFPTAKIFTGDAGAYMVGFLLAAISLMLVNRNPQVSAWMPLLLMIYPVFETLFSMYRKKILNRASVFKPDAYHLHLMLLEAHLD